MRTPIAPSSIVVVACLCAAVAVGGTLTADLATEPARPGHTVLNIDDSTGALTVANVDNRDETGSWTRYPAGAGLWAAALTKDGDLGRDSFRHRDPCLDASLSGSALTPLTAYLDESAVAAADTLQFTTGPYDPAAETEPTIASGTFALPGAMRVERVWFLTAGYHGLDHGGDMLYAVSFGSSAQTAVPIDHDSTGLAEGRADGNVAGVYWTLAWDGLVTNGVDSCSAGASGSDIVTVANPEPDTAISTLTITYSDAGSSFLGGPLALIVQTDQAAHDAAFTGWFGSYSSTSTVSELEFFEPSGDSAIWYELAWEQTDVDGTASVVELAVDCGRDDDRDGTVSASEWAHNVGPLGTHLGDLAEGRPLGSSCVGPAARVHVDLFPELLLSPTLTALSLKYDTDADLDGWTAADEIGRGGTDCDDTEPLANPGLSEDAAGQQAVGQTGWRCDGIDNDCDGVVDSDFPLEDDSDGDGLGAIEEAAAGTSDCDADVDDDGVLDGDELHVFGSDPFTADSDGDGVLDGTEVGTDCSHRDSAPSAGACVPDADRSSTSDPADADSDDDGLLDGVEDTNADGAVDPGETDAARADSDGDGLPDGLELGTDCSHPHSGAGCIPDADDASTTLATDPDSDDDGLPDGVEDKDRDGQLDAIESDPSSTDTDGDGIADGREDRDGNGVCGRDETCAYDEDSDDDGIVDGIEDANRSGSFDVGETDGRDRDTDDDGLHDGVEDANRDGVVDPGETDPTNPDTDADQLLDGLELGTTCSDAHSDIALCMVDSDPSSTTDPLDADTDGDGLTDGDEDRDRDGAADPRIETDPGDSDSDDDGVSDGVEVGPDPRRPVDTDADGYIDGRDADDDGDGVDTSSEDHGFTATLWIAGDGDPTNDDRDGDGVPDYLDRDDDGDGIDSALEDGDSDNDGVEDRLDFDDDEDGVPTLVERAAGTDPRGIDSDGDSVSDGVEWSAEPPGTDPCALPIDTWPTDGIIDAEGWFAFLAVDERPDYAGRWATAPRDTDGDGVIDALDLDDDGDGLLTVDEADAASPGGHPDGILDNTNAAAAPPCSSDCVPNYLSTDSDGDAFGDGEAGQAGAVTWLEDFEDHDGDGIANVHDCLDAGGCGGDSDGDGIEDCVEFCSDVLDARGECDRDGDLHTNPLLADSDADGVDDLAEVTRAGGSIASPTDTDGDGTIDALDPDDDGDSVPTRAEDLDGNGDPRDDDSDGDGVADLADTDDDGDGLCTGPVEFDRTCSGDEDVDNDGDPRNDDTDSDGVPNYLDTVEDGPTGDIDGDCLLNVDEPGDSDGDGRANQADSDDDGDGVPTIDEIDGCDPLVNRDSDGDGLPDYLDDDDDGDGIPTAQEGTFDPDGDGVPNYLDDDSDGDGVSDAVEAGLDADGDGVPDFIDDHFDVYDSGGQAAVDEVDELEPACGCVHGGSRSGSLGLILAAIALSRRRRRVASRAWLQRITISPFYWRMHDRL